MVRELVQQKEAIATLCRGLGVERLLLFGSATRGTSLSEVGDLDFLVRFKPMPPAEYAHRYFELMEKLEDMFRTPIDLVEIDQIRNPYFKEAVDETKVPVYEIA
jgi:predicted nucleotidyltransferase